MRVVEPDEWRRTVGAAIQRARDAKRLSKRRAAELAGFDEAVWRQIEQGERKVSGVMVAVNPRDENLEAAARVVDLDPAEVFALAGRSYTPPRTVVASGGDLDELRRLDPEYAAAVERMIEAGIAQARARRP